MSDRTWRLISLHICCKFVQFLHLFFLRSYYYFILSRLSRFQRCHSVIFFGPLVIFTYHPVQDDTPACSEISFEVISLLFPRLVDLITGSPGGESNNNVLVSFTKLFSVQLGHFYVPDQLPDHRHKDQDGESHPELFPESGN